MNRISTMQPNAAARGGAYAAYDRGAALDFFQAAGTLETVAPGEALFVEHQRAGHLALNRDKMYLLVQGEIDILAARKPIGAVKAGEIFGEMGLLSGSARSATAVARTPCRVIGLDERQLREGLAIKPEFVLMLARLMITRLRETLARLRASNAVAEDASGRQSAVFGAALLAELKSELQSPARVRFAPGDTILREGASGMLMYVVLEGRIGASIQGRTVERIGPGGVLGEIALVDQAPRVASAVAETHCTLLAINRIAFLQLLQKKPEFGASLLRGLSDRLRFLMSHGR
jgi:CRP-like cAMP-binding protein